jgi:hypothetical protein
MASPAGQAPKATSVTVTGADTGNIISANGALCLYGGSRTGKTTQLGELAKYIWKRYRKKTRLITAEVGNNQPLTPHIKAGLIEVFPINETVSDVAATLKGLYNGSWYPVIPKEIAGNTVKKLTPRTLNGLEAGEVGAYFIEGLTSLSERLIRNLASKGIKIGQDAVGTFNEASITDGQDLEKFGSPAMAHFGWVQNYMADLIAGFTALPVELVVFTAHESKGDDALDSTPVYGPGLVGKKATPQLPWKLGDLFHLDIINVPGKGTTPTSTSRRLYFFEHTDAINGSILWKASPRLTPSQTRALKSAFSEGYLDLDKESIVRYYEFREQLAISEEEEIRKMMASSDEAVTVTV